MTKIVYNACFGGFGLSDEGMNRFKELGGKTNSRWEIERTDPLLVQVVEELGDEVNTRFSNLQIIDLPEGTKYRIDEYDGNESVMTIDDYEWSTA